MKLLIPCLVFLTLICIINASAKSLSNSSNKITTDAHRKLREETEKKEITAFFTAKNLIKTAIKILFGSNEESTASTRQFLSFFVKFLDVMRGTFLTPQARSSTGAKELANQVFLEFERRLIKYLKLDDQGCIDASCLSTDGPISLNNIHQY